MITESSMSEQKGDLAEWDLEGWDAIAFAIGVSVRTAQRYADDPDDPMPIMRFKGNIRAREHELRVWVKRHTQRPA
jgi:hypothetical protein